MVGPKCVVPRLTSLFGTKDAKSKAGETSSKRFVHARQVSAVVDDVIHRISTHRFNGLLELISSVGYQSGKFRRRERNQQGLFEVLVFVRSASDLRIIINNSTIWS